MRPEELDRERLLTCRVGREPWLCQKSSEVTLRLNFQPRKKTVLISLRLLLPTKCIFDIKLDAGGGKGQKQREGWVTNLESLPFSLVF